jgi:hypothetical protein
MLIVTVITEQEWNILSMYVPTGMSNIKIIILILDIPFCYLQKRPVLFNVNTNLLSTLIYHITMETYFDKYGHLQTKQGTKMQTSYKYINV